MEMSIYVVLTIFSLITAGIVYYNAKASAISFVVFALILNVFSAVGSHITKISNNFCDYDNTSASWNCTTYSSYVSHSYLSGLYIANIILLSIVALFKLFERGAQNVGYKTTY